MTLLIHQTRSITIMINTDLPIYSLIILIAFLINIGVICYISYKKIDLITILSIC